MIQNDSNASKLLIHILCSLQKRHHFFRVCEVAASCQIQWLDQRNPRICEVILMLCQKVEAFLCQLLKRHQHVGFTNQRCQLFNHLARGLCFCLRICGTCSTSPCLHCDAANQGFAHENLFSLSGRNEFPQGKRVVLARTSLHQVEGTALILKSAMDLDGQTLLAPVGPPNWSISVLSIPNWHGSFLQFQRSAKALTQTTLVDGFIQS